MNETKKFPEITDAGQRLNAMQNSCDKVLQDEKYQYVYTEEEKQTLREMCLDLDDKIDAKEEHKKAVTAEVNAALKDLKSDKKDLRIKVRAGYTEKTGTLFAFADQKEGKMNFYNTEGEFVKSRALAPQERQGHLLHMKAVNE